MDGITRARIAALQLRALRKGVYFRVLNRLQRGLLYCLMRSVDTVKVGGRMWQVLVQILSKLEQALQSRINEFVESGKHAAVRFSDHAVSWGNVLAIEWRYDRCYQLALGLNVLFSNSLVRDV